MLTIIKSGKKYRKYIIKLYIKHFLIFIKSAFKYTHTCIYIYSQSEYNNTNKVLLKIIIYIKTNTISKPILILQNFYHIYKLIQKESFKL